MTTAAVVLRPEDDAQSEPPETAGFAIIPTDAYDVGTPPSVILTIRDNDPPAVIAASVVQQSGPPHRLRLTFTQDVSASLSAADVSVQRLGPGGVGAVAVAAPAYDGASNTATFALGATRRAFSPTGTTAPHCRRRG